MTLAQKQSTNHYFYLKALAAFTAAATITVGIHIATAAPTTTLATTKITATAVVSAPSILPALFVLAALLLLVHLLSQRRAYSNRGGNSFPSTIPYPVFINGSNAYFPTHAYTTVNDTTNKHSHPTSSSHVHGHL